MTTEELENQLRDLRFKHLGESELTAYVDEELNQIGRARVEAHLKHCYKCERQLELLREESLALKQQATSAKDLAFVEGILDQLAQPKETTDNDRAERRIAVPWRERLAEALRQMTAVWQVAFAPVRSGSESKEVWRWQSDDGLLQARATMEDADLVVRISSGVLELVGVRLRFRLGSLVEELTLTATSPDEVSAQIAIPSQYRRGRIMKDIAIEII